MQDAVYCAQQGGPGFIVEHNDHAGGGQWGTTPESLVNTPATMEAWTQLSKSWGWGGEAFQDGKEICLELTNPPNPPLHTPVSLPCCTWE